MNKTFGGRPVQGIAADDSRGFADKAGRAIVVVLAVLVLGAAGSVRAQSRVLGDKGLAKLGVFIGTWKAESTDSANAGKVSAEYTCTWSANGNFLIADQKVSNHGTSTNNLSIYSYNTTADDYTLTLVGIPGMAPFTIPVAYSGDTLIYHSEYTSEGKKMYNRTLNIFSSPTDYKFLIQNSTDGVNWRTDGEGVARKVHK